MASNGDRWWDREHQKAFAFFTSLALGALLTVNEFVISPPPEPLAQPVIAVLFGGPAAMLARPRNGNGR